MKQILVVDDSVTMRRMVIACLRNLEAVSFAEAGDGLEALEQLAIAPIHLMILDLNMPGMHGLEVLKFVRKQKNHQKLPIIVLTTRGDELTRTEVMASGASLYLTKPFNARELTQKADELLSQIELPIDHL